MSPKEEIHLFVQFLIHILDDADDFVVEQFCGHVGDSGRRHAVLFTWGMRFIILTNNNQVDDDNDQHDIHLRGFSRLPDSSIDVHI